MGTVYIGSARIGENGKATGGKVGDQKQTTSTDYKGEVSMQTLASFVKGRKLYILRPKQCAHAQKIAQGMKIACNNINLGYSQTCSRYAPDDINTKIKINVDCSKLIRDVIYYATGIDVGNFTTSNEVSVLVNSGLFDRPIVYNSNTKVYEGDVFVTQNKGHTGACTDGLSRDITKTLLTKNGVDFSHVFDPKFYSDANADVKATCGYDTTKLFNHFLTFGMTDVDPKTGKFTRSGKTISTFNVEVYASHNPDLVKAYGTLSPKNVVSYYKHYCTNGYKENRRTI